MARRLAYNAIRTYLMFKINSAPGTKFARWVFTIAGIYGVIVLLPQYFMENRFEHDLPPAITHPEHFYGFIGVTLGWQLVYLLIGTDPIRYRPVMVIAILAKLSFGIACMMLYLQGRLARIVLAASSVDMILALLFAVCFWMTRKTPTEN